ncbi:hypothetical protein [Rhizobium mesoamericanum]|nr:hypothetical protein [Rhizobium mesoamericanum]
MDKSRYTSPIPLIAAGIAGYVVLIRQEGFFAAVFRSDIRVSVRTEEALGVTGPQSRIKGAAVGHRPTRGYPLRSISRG